MILPQVTPRSTRLTFRTRRSVPRVGVMLVGWGGNNGSTVTAAVLANRGGLRWQTKEGQREANYYGSITQASTVSLGTDVVREEARFCYYIWVAYTATVAYLDAKSRMHPNLRFYAGLYAFAKNPRSVQFCVQN